MWQSQPRTDESPPIHLKGVDHPEGDLPGKAPDQEAEVPQEEETNHPSAVHLKGLENALVATNADGITVKRKVIEADLRVTRPNGLGPDPEAMGNLERRRTPRGGRALSLPKEIVNSVTSVLTCTLPAPHPVSPRKKELSRDRARES